MPAVSVLLKPSSGLCNMACDYCFYYDESQNRGQESYGFMSEETLKNVIRRTMLTAEGAASYTFQGGEPTLRGLDFFQKAIALQQHYNRNHLPVRNALQTNGTLLDAQWCRFLKEAHFLVGLSVDGLEEIHNSIRHFRDGAGTFSQAVRSAKLMDQFQVDYNILTVVTPAIAGNIRRIYREYRKRGWNYQQYIACLEPLQEGRGNRPYSLTPQIYGRFLIELFQLWYEDFQRGDQPYIRQIENFICLAAGYPAESCDQRGTCSIQYAVEADGSVYPCDFYMLDEYCLGNFNRNKMDEINRKREQIGFIVRSENRNPKCRECRYYRLCRGGCQRNRQFNSAAGFYENYFCESFLMFFDACHDKILAAADRLLPKLTLRL